MTAPQVPENLAPVNGSTVTSSAFFVSATLLPWPNKQKAQFQFATNSGFTTGVQSAESVFRNPGSLSLTAGAPRLPQGSVWVRVRAIDELSLDASPWSNPVQVTVDHPSSGRMDFPGQGETIPWTGGVVDFQWTFSDPSVLDSQTAYQIKVLSDDLDNTYAVLAQVYGNYTSLAAVNDDYADISTSGGLATLVDTGKVASTAQTRTLTIPTSGRNEVVSWVLRTWDDDDKTAGFTNPKQFFVGDMPTVAITHPTSTANTPTPTITWSYNSLAGHSQASFRVRFYGATNGNLIFDSTLQSGATTSYTPPSQVLKNGTPVRIQLDVSSSIGMQTSTSVTITPTWVAPPNPSFTVSRLNYDDFGRVELEWFDAVEDPTFIEWRLYRRDSDASEWVQLATTTDRMFMDHSAPPLETVQYSITQVGTAFGVQVESQLFPINVDMSSTYYLLKVKDQPGLAMRLSIVTGDSFSHQYEEEVMDIIGVGRKAEVGTSYGRQGTLTVHFRDMGWQGAAANAYDTLKEIKESGLACYLRIPYSETLEVHISNLQVNRIPGVVSELSDITFEYTEIS